LACKFFFGLEDEFFRKQLQGHKLLCAMEGSRCFRNPTDLGLMRYEGCEIVLFDNASHAAVDDAFQASLEKAKKKIAVRTHQVAIFEEKENGDVWSLHVARPQAGVILCASNKNYLEEVLRRMDRPPEQRALPAHLPEWSHVNLNAPVWAVRHYRKDGVAEDPSSPLAPMAAPRVADPHAIGIVFWFDPAGNGKGYLRYLTESKNATELIQSRWSDPREKENTRVEQIAPGLVQVSRSFVNATSVGGFLLILMFHIGHGIYI
jgi:hypothetical protein